MSYRPDRCWGDLELTGAICPLKVVQSNNCPGGYECDHRAGTESRQCPNLEETEIGLCNFHYQLYVGSLKESV